MRMHSRSPQSQLQRRRSRSCEDIKGIITHKSKHTQHKNETTHKKSLVIVQPPSLSRLSLLDYTLCSLNAIHIPKHTHTAAMHLHVCVCAPVLDPNTKTVRE